MRRLSLVLVLVAVPAFADEKAKPNTLTPKEIAEGWILLFDGETTFGLDVPAQDTMVKDGVLEIRGKFEGTHMRTWFGPCELRLEVSADRKTWAAETHVVDRAHHDKAEGGLPLGGGKPAPVGGFDVPTRKFTVLGTGEPIYVRSLRCRPTATEPLFNGKDLTGWKLYDAGRARAVDPKKKDVPVKSQYTVTKEGWLNVKNGPGDLQTEGQWADFVVQLECISNGKHLNSGLFFRAIPDLYQEGYEAQIRNEWMGDDRTKPVDFGTGAIYRRQPARKVVSTDGEWFTMTVAAHGRHLATWVNGYQVTDWTDDRKEADNGRNGFKKGKGALSIQGHDPTTDLSFRNIRIQSLDPK